MRHPDLCQLQTSYTRTSMSGLLTHLMGCLLFHLVNSRGLLFYGHFIILYVGVYLSPNLSATGVYTRSFITLFTSFIR